MYLYTANMAVCRTNVRLVAVLVIFTIITEVYGGYSFFGDKKIRNNDLERCEEDLRCCKSKSVNCKRLEYELLTVTTCKARLEREVEELKCALKKCKKHSKQFEDQVICMTNTINELKAKLERKEKEIEDCDNRIGLIEEKYKIIINETDVKYQECKTEVIKILGELDDTIDKLKNCTDNTIILEGELEDCRNETDKLVTKVIVLEDELRTKKKLLEDCDAEVEVLKLANVTCQAKAKALEDALAECEANADINADLLIKCNKKAEAEAEAAAACNAELVICSAKSKNLTDQVKAIFQYCEDKFITLDQSKFIFVGKKTFYPVNDQIKNWYDAENWCWDHGMEGLACPTSEKEFFSITSELVKLSPDVLESWHLGFNRNDQPANTWWCDKTGKITNSEITWWAAPDEPNNRDDKENVLTAIYKLGAEWGLNDRPFGDELKFVCQVDQSCVDVLYEPAI